MDLDDTCLQVNGPTVYFTLKKKRKKYATHNSLLFALKNFSENIA